MSASYFLRSPFLGDGTHIEITKDDFFKLENSKIIIREYISFEESLFQLLKTYSEFEKYLLTSALDFLNFPQADWDFFQDIRIDANIRVVSVLNAMTSVRDQAPKLNSPQLGVTLNRRLRTLWDEHRSTSTSFSFAERLRNYAQHQTQPISRTSTGGGWKKDDDLCEHHTSVYVDTLAVCNNRGIDRDEKERYLHEYGDMVDIAGLLREALSIIAKIASTLRSEFEQPVTESLSTYDYYLTIRNETPTHYDAVAANNRLEDKKFSIFPGLVERAKKLKQQRYLTNFEKHYISNRLRGHSTSMAKKPISLVARPD
ncbi:hypothetical protein [Rhizobium sp.]|uniref:hypothetical protein n=1 Tax=Rhizobium sp. TaxID=391 RepID=UPI002899701E